jgi:uncharacterized protein YcfL
MCRSVIVGISITALLFVSCVSIAEAQTQRSSVVTNQSRLIRLAEISKKKKPKSGPLIESDGKTVKSDGGTGPGGTGSSGKKGAN